MTWFFIFSGDSVICGADLKALCTNNTPLCLFPESLDFFPSVAPLSQAGPPLKSQHVS